MIKKSLLLMSTCAVLATLAAALLAAVPRGASADIIVLCPVGTNNGAYCTAQKYCNVQVLVGKRLKKAKNTIRKHDCRVGKVTRLKRRKGHKFWMVVKQRPRPGLYAASIKVNLVVQH